MNEQMDPTIVELTDQSGRTFQFRYVMAMEVAGKTYVVLSELEPQNAQQEDELLFLRVEKTADGLDEYVVPDDPEEVESVFEKYVAYTLKEAMDSVSDECACECGDCDCEHGDVCCEHDHTLH